MAPTWIALDDTPRTWHGDPKLKSFIINRMKKVQKTSAAPLRWDRKSKVHYNAYNYILGRYSEGYRFHYQLSFPAILTGYIENIYTTYPPRNKGNELIGFLEKIPVGISLKEIDDTINKSVAESTYKKLYPEQGSLTERYPGIVTTVNNLQEYLLSGSETISSTETDYAYLSDILSKCESISRATSNLRAKLKPYSKITLAQWLEHEFDYHTNTPNEEISNSIIEYLEKFPTSCIKNDKEIPRYENLMVNQHMMLMCKHYEDFNKPPSWRALSHLNSVPIITSSLIYIKDEIAPYSVSPIYHGTYTEYKLQRI